MPPNPEQLEYERRRREQEQAKADPFNRAQQKRYEAWLAARKNKNADRDYTYHVPSLWDWVLLIALEVQCAVFLILCAFWLARERLADASPDPQIRAVQAQAGRAKSRPSSGEVRDGRPVAVVGQELK
jgi:hypothetical protein